jgi:hypothetical protein
MNDARFYYSSLIASAFASLFITTGITSFVVGCSGSSNTDLTGDGGTGGGGGGGGLGGLGGGGGGGTNKPSGGGDGTSTPPSKADPGGPGLGGAGGAGGAVDAQCTFHTGGGASCDSCTAQTCCTEVKACKANSACMQIFKCAEACAGDQECVVECLETNPTGQVEAQTLARCGTNKCACK